MQTRSATVLFSGGIDSLCCVDFLRTQGFLVQGLFVNYGQVAASHEREAVEALASKMQIPMQSVYCEAKRHFSSGEVIGRNQLLISLGLVYSGMTTGVLAIGIHAGTDYFDCSEKYFQSSASLIAEQSNGRIELVAPFLTWQKTEIYKFALDRQLPIESTYSCEQGDWPPCGGCLSCRDRENLHALQKSG